MNEPAATSPTRPSTTEGAVTVIAGAAGALGSAIATRLASPQAVLALVDIDRAALNALAETLRATGAWVEVFACDLLDDTELAHTFADIEQRLGSPETLISCAGVEINAAFHTISPDEIDIQLGLHLRSPMLMVHHALPPMLTRDRGRILIVSSMCGKVPLPVKAPYAAAKAGAIAFGHSLRRELLDTGITVSVITPGVVSGAGQAHRALTGTTVQVPKTLGMVSVAEVADAVLDALATGRAERAVQGRGAALISALQAAAPTLVDRLLARTGIGEFWRAVAREHGRA
ncbi:SDR family NAD(P)-dependent oxidoreductase [Nocardia takedensis]